MISPLNIVEEKYFQTYLKPNFFIIIYIYVNKKLLLSPKKKKKKNCFMFITSFSLALSGKASCNPHQMILTLGLAFAIKPHPPTCSAHQNTTKPNHILPSLSLSHHNKNKKLYCTLYLLFRRTILI